jgi:DNA repair protein RadD
MSTLDLFSTPSTLRFPAPRAFQEKTHVDLRNGFQAGHQRQLVMAPTGAGKTYLALRLVSEALRRGGRALFICDRTTLIKQTSEAADAYGMPTHGIIQAENPRFALFRPFQIASAQTIEARGIEDKYQLIVVDEAHTVYAAITKLILETKAAVIGLSATPFTKGLGKTYSNVINAATMKELVELGVLTPLRIMTCVKPDMVGAKTKGGEWTAGDAGKRGLVIVGDVVREWLEHAENRKSIVFGPTVAHATALVEKFKEAGVRAELFTGKTTDEERKQLLEEYRKPDSSIRLLISVEALAKGFDVPDVSCVVDCRPLRKSLSTFVQMIGRGLRSSAGKTDCLLLDHSGNALRFADDFSDLYHYGLSALDEGEKLDSEVRKDEGKAPKSCPACSFSPCGKKCIRCGFEAKSNSLIEHEEGRAEEIDILGHGRSAYAATKQALYAMIATHERLKSERRVESGRPPGNPKGAAAHRFKELTGNWPPRAWTFEAQPEVIPTSALQGKLRSMEIAFAKSRRSS